MFIPTITPEPGDTIVFHWQDAIRVAVIVTVKDGVFLLPYALEIPKAHVLAAYKHLDL